MLKRPLFAKTKQAPIHNPWIMVLYFSLPVMALQWLGVLSSTITPRFLAHYSTHALAASALTYRAFLIILLCMNGFQFAQGVVIAQTDDAKRSQAIQQSSLFILIISFICAGFIWLMPWILHLSHQSPPLIALAAPYFHVLALTCPVMALNGLWQQVLLVYRKPLYLAALAIIYFIAAVYFNHLFILGNHWLAAGGLGGSAWGELSAQLCVALITCLFVLCGIKKLSFRSLWPVWNNKIHTYKKQWSLGWPIALRWMNEMFAMGIIALLIGHFGVTALGSFRIVSQIELLILMIPYSINIALAILMSEAKSHTMISKLIQKSLWLTAIPLFICSLLFWIMPAWLLTHLFGLQSHQIAIIHLGTQLLMITAIAQLFNGSRQIINGALRALGDTLYPLLFSMISFWGIAVFGSWVAITYWHGHTPAIWWILTFTYVLACLLSATRLISKRQK